MTRAAGALLAVAATGCTLITDSFVTNDFSGDPFPIRIAQESGAVVIGLREDDTPDRVAVLDVLSPLTLVDPGLGEDPSIRTANITLLGLRSDGAAMDVPRARITGTDLLSVHPCAAEACAVGPLGGEREIGAIVGANVLAGDALRLRLGTGEAFLLADIGGTDRDRSYVCDAVFPSPYRGGGTLVIAGTEVGFAGRRVMLQGCLGPNADPDQPIGQSRRGTDVLFVMSTGIGASLLSEAAYQRYVLGHPGAAPLDMLDTAIVFLPSGPVMGRRAIVPALALIAGTGSSGRAPCRQAYSHRFLLERNCIDEPGEDCPCTNGDAFCSVPAIVELAGGVEVLVVGDDNPTLQALRAELRPDQPEVDGILGTGALPRLEVDVDYPHNRVLMRCAAPGCTVRPALAERGDRDQVANCIAATAMPLPP